MEFECYILETVFVKWSFENSMSIRLRFLESLSRETRPLWFSAMFWHVFFYMNYNFHSERFLLVEISYWDTTKREKSEAPRYQYEWQFHVNRPWRRQLTHYCDHWKNEKYIHKLDFSCQVARLRFYINEIEKLKV